MAAAMQRQQDAPAGQSQVLASGSAATCSFKNLSLGRLLSLK